MIFNQCYFISYFTDTHRVERRRMLKKAVKWAFDKDFDVTIIASNWIHEDYLQFADCQIVSVPVRLPPGHMRNIALSMFYAGNNDEWCIILDDDTWIATGDGFIDTMRKMKGAGAVWGLSVEDEVDTPISNDTHYELTQSIYVKSGVFIVRNGCGVFFNPAYKYYDDKLMFGEDVNFMARCCYAGKDFRMVANAQVNLSRSRFQLPSTWLDPEEDVKKRFLPTKAMRELDKIDFTPPQNGVLMNGNQVGRLKAPTIYWEKL